MTKKDGRIIKDRQFAQDNAIEAIEGITEELKTKLEKGTIGISGLEGDIVWPQPKPDPLLKVEEQKKQENLVKWTGEDHERWLEKTKKVS